MYFLALMIIFLNFCYVYSTMLQAKNCPLQGWRIMTSPGCARHSVHIPTNGRILPKDLASLTMSSTISRPPLCSFLVPPTATCVPCCPAGCSGLLGMPGAAQTMLLCSPSGELWTELVWGLFQRNLYHHKHIISSCTVSMVFIHLCVYYQN